MRYISSDTNVWLDFAAIGRLSLPFRLPYIYLMNDEMISDEMNSPAELGANLLRLGLRATELTEEEFFLAEELNQKYRRPSLYDCIALAIAKCRGITLLSGDGPLRKAAESEGVPVIGTIRLIDELFEANLIDPEEYLYCLRELLRNNGGKVRLPGAELRDRIERIESQFTGE